MIHITEQDYRRIREDLESQIDETGPVTTELMVGGGDYLLTVEGMGHCSCTTHKVWDEAWGRGGWFEEKDYKYSIEEVTAECSDEDGEIVDSDFDASKVECDWECSGWGDS